MRLVLVLSAAFWASAALGALVLDGNVGTGEYTYHIPDSGDPALDQYVGTGLDMTAIYSSYDLAHGQIWLGLTTAQTIVTDGQPGLSDGYTIFAAELLNGTNPVYLMNVNLGEKTLDLSHWNGSVWVPSSTVGMDFKTDTGLEIVAPVSLLPDLTADFSFNVTLDGTGEWRDDQLIGQLPEPASMLLLAAALPMLLRRRRQSST